MDLPVAVALELGAKRIFASAIEWPGWARSARDEEEALATLAGYGDRYRQVVARLRLAFEPPADASAFRVVERLPGNATTDFGAPGASLAADERSLDAADLDRQVRILRATWRAFDAAAEGARGVPLRKGPRGGGRDVATMTKHVLDAERGYVGALGVPVPRRPANSAAALAAWRDSVVASLGVAAGGGVPPVGPRGGKRWTARFFVRRAAWHVLDHAWEIEDRAARN